MKWYKNVYVGDNAKKKKSAIVAKTEGRIFQHNIYLITLPSQKDNLLEMFSANELIQPHYKNRDAEEGIYIVGIAKGYDEAVTTMAAVLTDTYTHTGGFDVAEYLGFGKKI